MGDKLDTYFPSTDENINEELCRALSYLEHPGVVSKTVALMKVTKVKASQYNAEILKRNKGYGGKILQSMGNSPNILNMHYLFCLKDVKAGWTMDDRKFYLGWVKDLASRSGGNLYRGYIDKIRGAAINSVPENDRLALKYLMGDIKTVDLGTLPKPKGPSVEWTVESALKVFTEQKLVGRSLENGKRMFMAGQCVACHYLGNTGAGVGPDLTNLTKRADYKSMLESIIAPDLVVSDQFAQHVFLLFDGQVVSGRIASEDDGEVAVMTSGVTPDKLTRFKVDDIESRKLSKTSMMPTKLIDGMNAEELKDLIAYFVSQGDPKHAVYKRPKTVNMSVKKRNIELISAIYGAPDTSEKSMDVRKVLQRQLDLRDYNFAISNNLVGRDPAPGIVKTLTLKYTIDGKTTTKTVRENQMIEWK